MLDGRYARLYYYCSNMYGALLFVRRVKSTLTKQTCLERRVDAMLTIIILYVSQLIVIFPESIHLFVVRPEMYSQDKPTVTLSRALWGREEVGPLLA